MADVTTDLNALVGLLGAHDVSGRAILDAISSAPQVGGFQPPPGFDDSTDIRPLPHIVDASRRIQYGLRPLGIAGLEHEAQLALRHAESDPGSESTDRTAAALGRSVPPVYTIRIHAVLCADDNGTGAAKPAEMPAFIESVIPQINAAYQGAGIRFYFNKDADFEFQKSTLLNRDLTIPTGTVFGTDPGIPPLNEAQAKAAAKNHHNARTKMAAQRRGKLVIFFSDGNRLMYDKEGKRWMVVDRGGGFSSHEMDYLVTWAALNKPKDPGTILGTGNHLSHEIGHNLHLPHTFGGYAVGHPDMSSTTITTKTKLDDVRKGIADRIRSYVAAGNPRSSGTGAVDGDARDNFLQAITDTPPDPGPDLFVLENRMAGVTSNETCGAIKRATVEVEFGNHDVVPYDLEPDQDNMMSYFPQCNAKVPPHASAQQVTRMRSALELLNRRHLLFPVGSEWYMDTNGYSVSLQVTGAGATAGGFWGTMNDGSRTSEIQGLWDVNSRRILFTRVIRWVEIGGPDISTTQVYSGFLFHTKREPMLAGSFEAFQGTGADAQRNVFGWTAKMVPSQEASDVGPREWWF